MSAQHAFVLTSSPANAAYEVGVMKALMRGRWGQANNEPVDPYCYTGSSVGAFNAAIMVGGGDQTVAETLEELERIWVDRIASDRPASANGILRVRTLPSKMFDTVALANDPLRPIAELGSDMLHLTAEFFKRAAYAASGSGTLPDRMSQAAVLSQLVDFTPLHHLLAEVVRPESIRMSARKLRVTALDWDRGKPRTFSNTDFHATNGADLLLGVMSQAVLMDPVQVGGASYVDASAIHDRPLQPAIDAAPESGTDEPLVLHIVYNDADTSPVRLSPLDNSFTTLYRLFMFALSRSVNADIARADSINDHLAIHKLLGDLAARDDKTMDQVLEELGPAAVNTWRNLRRDLDGKRHVTVHRFRPTENRGFEFHNLERSRIQRVIDNGYEEALRHDCEKSDCVDPAKPRKKPRR